jgi:hypothetical protein
LQPLYFSGEMIAVVHDRDVFSFRLSWKALRCRKDWQK